MNNDITNAQIIEDDDGTEKEDLGDFDETSLDPFNPGVFQASCRQKFKFMPP